MRRFLTCICCMAALMFILNVNQAWAEDKPAAAPSADEQAMMKKWMEMMAPGAEHQGMAKSVGKWTGAMKYWMQPGAPPSETTTTKVVTMDMDGRYMIEDETSNMNGMPYHGRSTVGYDKFRGEYVSSYYDNMSTGIMWASGGHMDKDGKTITFNTKMDDPMTNRKDVPTRMIVSLTDNDHHSFEMWTMAPDGKEYKCMECMYTRMNEASR